jgi:hypothetical protein
VTQLKVIEDRHFRQIDTQAWIAMRNTRHLLSPIDAVRSPTWNPLAQRLRSYDGQQLQLFVALSAGNGGIDEQ